MNICKKATLYCEYCKRYTNISGHFVLTKTKQNVILLSGLCVYSKRSKCNSLNDEMRRALPYDVIFNSAGRKMFIENLITNDGRIIPLFQLVNNIINSMLFADYYSQT